MRKGLWISFIILPMILACSPVTATRSIKRAETALAAAVAAGGDKKCPYEYTTAVISLEYAKSREGVSEFEAAATFAENARKKAERARVKAALIADGNTARLDEEDVE